MKLTAREIPSMDVLLKDEKTANLIENYPRETVLEALRAAADELRILARADKITLPENLKPRDAAKEIILEKSTNYLEKIFSQRFLKVINAQGVVLHTNLGRTPLAKEAIESILRTAGGYSNLEMDLDSGERSHRSSIVSELLYRITGSEAALVVNNNAASLYLILDALARDREVIVSRGELIEIGGSFRLPEILAKSGAKIIEVGTTNRTYLSDYEKAVTENTGLLLKSHCSNFFMDGFVSSVDTESLAALGKKTGIPSCEDLGSGLLIDLKEYGLPREPLVQEVVASGIDIVCFSGDKLLGGPQAGIITGRKDLIGILARNPMMRAFRPGKLTFAALESTLRLYLNPKKLLENLPVLKMLTRPPAKLKSDARKLAKNLKMILKDRAEVSTMELVSPVGGGSLPSGILPAFLVSIKPYKMGEEDLARRLRLGNPPIIARTITDSVLIDVRTLLPGDDKLIEKSLAKILDI